MNSIWFDPSEQLIGGTWRGTPEQLRLINPSDGTSLAQIARGARGDIDAAVSAAHAARNGTWGRMTAAERGRILMDIGRLVETPLKSWPLSKP